MGKQRKYKKFLLCSLLILIFTSCTKKEFATNYENQKKSLNSYMGTLTSGYFVRNDDVYISMTEDRSAPDAEPLETGDKISIYYAEHIMNNTSLGTVVWTNSEEWAEEYQWAPTGESDFSPLEFVYGDSGIVKGLEIGLKGCKKGQELIIAMPFTQAYGEKWISTVPPYSAIRFRVFVENITKKE